MTGGVHGRTESYLIGSTEFTHGLAGAAIDRDVRCASNEHSQILCPWRWFYLGQGRRFDGFGRVVRLRVSSQRSQQSGSRWLNKVQGRMAEPKKSSARSNFRAFFLRGLAILLPSVLTVWIVIAAYNFIQQRITTRIIIV